MTRRVAPSVLLILLLWLVPVGLLAAPSASAAPVRIDAVTHNAKGPLKAGDRVTVTLRGTAGGAATFALLGVDTDLGMREVRTGTYTPEPAVYTGTYIVQAGNVVNNGIIFATLTARGTTLVAASTQPITIDTRPPVLTARFPKPEATLANLRPNISIEFVDLESGVNPASVRLVVNGQNVTAQASVSAASVSYNPPTPFRPGPVRVELTVADRAGNTLRASWGFFIVTPDGLITSVTINPASTLTRDDVLTVVMAGAKGGKASFAIQGVRAEFPMKESGTKGVYFGTLTVRAEHATTDAPVLVTLTSNGRKSTLPASALVTILAGRPAAPTVATSNRSLSLEDPTARLILSGTSRPGFRILGRIGYEARSSGLAPEGTLGEFLAIADANGRWRASLGPLVPLPGARLVITVVAIDSADQRSPPATLELTLS